MVVAPLLLEVEWVFSISTEYTDNNGSVQVEKSTLEHQMKVL